MRSLIIISIFWSKLRNSNFVCIEIMNQIHAKFHLSLNNIAATIQFSHNCMQYSIYLYIQK